jgi:hypothetical protein
MNTSNPSVICVNCGRSEAEIPVLQFHFKGQARGICSNCLPVLLHKPERLVGRLPGMENIAPAPHSHD